MPGVHLNNGSNPTSPARITETFSTTQSVIRAGDVCGNKHGNPPISNRLLPLAGHAYAEAERTIAWTNPFHHNVFQRVSRSSRRIDSAAPDPAQRQRLKPPPATGNRLKPVRVIAGARKTGSTVMTTYSSSGSRQSERAYYAFGDDRRTVNTPLTDNLFTGQKQDDTGLYYYNARYYDPEIGHFISPDTIVPDPLRVDAYNRYMYAYGNPLKFNDPSGRFSEQQLIEWYGENWRDQFAAEWQKLLLDDPGSSNFGAQLGDLVAYGDSQGILVLDPDNQLALWDFNAKSAQTVASVGASAPDSLGLYRVKSGLSGENTGRFPTGGETLAATQGFGVGPYDMELLPGYSTPGMDYQAVVPADWFMGNVSSGYYVNNRMKFDGVDKSILSITSSGATLVSLAVEVAQHFDQKA